jgi:hypothetical protein
VRVNKGSDWLPLGEVVVRIGLGAMCPAVSGEKFAPTENAGYLTVGGGGQSEHIQRCIFHAMLGIKLIQKSLFL